MNSVLRGVLTKSIFTQFSFENSEEVRSWRILLALSVHSAGDFSVSPEQLALSFNRIIQGVRKGKIILSYSPVQLNTVVVAPINSPIHLQSVIYWCSEFNCSLDSFYEAYAVSGRGARTSIVRRLCDKLDGKHSIAGWMKTVLAFTNTLQTIPVALRVN